MVMRHTAMRKGKLESFLRRELGLSYGLVKRLKYQGAYRVNGAIAKTNHPVAVGDVITVTIEETAREIIAPEEGALAILHEDDYVLALDKPAGMIMHPTFNRVSGTLANRLLGYYQRTGQKSAVHFVSRLDRDTAGVVLVAKNAHVKALLCDPAQSDKLAKVYHAAVFGHPSAEHSEICHPIARLSPTSLLRCVREGGQAARSGYRVLQKTPRCALLEMIPYTGRTHQLRVHCAHEGYPMLGDVQYGTVESQAFSLAHGYAYQQLCAASLAFIHPMTKERMTLQSGTVIRLPAEG